MASSELRLRQDAMVVQARGLNPQVPMRLRVVWSAAGPKDDPSIYCLARSTFWSGMGELEAARRSGADLPIRNTRMRAGAIGFVATAGPASEEDVAAIDKRTVGRFDGRRPLLIHTSTEPGYWS